jgi:hypothetical protein
MQVNAVDDARARAQAGESLQLLAPSARLRAPTDQLFDGWLGQDERESWINIESEATAPHLCRIARANRYATLVCKRGHVGFEDPIPLVSVKTQPRPSGAFFIRDVTVVGPGTLRKKSSTNPPDDRWRIDVDPSRAGECTVAG